MNLSALGLLLLGACSDVSSRLASPDTNADGSPAPRSTPGARSSAVAPQPATGDVVLWSDAFDQYTGVSRDGSTLPLARNYARAGAVSLVSGYGGGKAVRFTYSAANTYNLIEKGIAANTDLHVRFRYRVSPGADPTQGGRAPNGMTWFYAMRDGGGNYNFAVKPGSTGAPIAFTVRDASSTNEPNPVRQNVSTTPAFGTTNDGGWHEYVAHLVTGSAGYEQVWIDGTRVLDTRGAGYTHSAGAITMFRLPGELTISPTTSFTVDIDDLAIWHSNGAVTPPPPPPAPAPVASVTVSPANPSVVQGASVQLTARTYDSTQTELTGRSVAWASADPTIATVSSTGLVTAVKAGGVVITASSEGRSATASLTVTAPAPTPAPVATVSITPTAASIQAGQTQQLTAALRDANGVVLTGRTVSWTSSNGSAASVSASGLVTGSAAGSATITATSEGRSGSASLTVTAVAPPPPPPGNSPEPGVGSVVVLQDNFDRSPVSSQLSGYATRGVMQTTTGRSGNALRFVYTGSSYDNLIEKNIPETRDFYVRYWYRLSPGADPTCGDRGGSGMKWFMAWRTNGPRYTNGVGNLSNGPTGRQNRGNEFSTHDNSSLRQPNPFLSNVNNDIRLSTTNDGQWHRYTLHIVTGTGGYEQIWIDGTKVLDNSGFGYDHAAEGIGMIQFPGTLVSWFSGCDFTIDVDDLAVWHP